MKFPELKTTEESQSMSAMTDVVFLLLIFFIVTMSSYAEMTLLETKLPTASSSTSNQPKLENPVRIDIPAPVNGQSIYLLNGSAFNSSNINILLRRYARLMPEAEFLINCSPDSEHHQLVTLLAHCATHKLKNLKLVNSK
jgi:biopolymer transport protein ExbD